jgi:hypothetical protein
MCQTPPGRLSTFAAGEIMRTRLVHARSTPTLVALALVAVIGAGASGCRKGRRGLRVGADAPTLKVSLLNLEAADEGKPEYIYELSGCVDTVTGKLDPDHADVVRFTALGLKPGLTGCQIKIKSLAPAAGITFATDSEPGTLYWARDLLLARDVEASLTAVAPLQKLYTVGVPALHAFSLKVPVRFPAPETGKVVTAWLDCDPGVSAVAALVRKSDLEAEFNFKIDVQIATDIACRTVQVFADGALSYVGAFDGDHGKFTATAQTAQTLAPVTLTVVPVGTQPGTDGGVAVETKADNCNQDGKVFDIGTGECKAAPN